MTSAWDASPAIGMANRNLSEKESIMGLGRLIGWVAGGAVASAVVFATAPAALIGAGVGLAMQVLHTESDRAREEEERDAEIERNRKPSRCPGRGIR